MLYDSEQLANGLTFLVPSTKVFLPSSILEFYVYTDQDMEEVKRGKMKSEVKNRNANEKKEISYTEREKNKEMRTERKNDTRKNETKKQL